jgi:D-3-phosphoglycerate dehydrogenase
MIPVLVSTSRFDPENFDIAAGDYRSRLSPTFNPHGRKLTEGEVSDCLSAGVVGLIAGLEPLTRNVLQRATNLRVIARVGTGLDSIDLAAANELGIAVVNTPDATTDAVAELTLAHILNALRGVAAADRNIRAGSWSPFMGRLLKGKTVGIIGFGRIGRRVAQLVGAFGAHVVFTDPAVSENDDSRWRSLMSLCAESDVVSLHVPLTTQTEGLIGAQQLSAMKQGAILINVARGGLVDEAALYTALNKNHIWAALDCFAEEPYLGNLRASERITMTAHMGSYATETRTLMEREAVSALIREFEKTGLL